VAYETLKPTYLRPSETDIFKVHLLVLYLLLLKTLTIPVAARYKAQVFGRSPVEIVGSNPPGGMNVCLL
jgi:hypothetical protein